MSLKASPLDNLSQELSFLSDLVISVGKKGALDRINEFILTRCVAHFQVEQGVIHLLSPSRSGGAVTTTIQLRTQERIMSASESVPLRLEIELAARLIRDRHPLIVNDFRREFQGIAEKAEQFKSLLAVPLVAGNRVIGVITLFNRVDGAPFTEADGTLLEAIAVPAAQVIENSRLVELDEHLLAARSVQQHLLPREVPNVPGLDLSGSSEPALEVGGDYYDWFDLAGGRLGCVVADVSGKGMPAALLMAEFQGAFRAVARMLDAPDLVLNAVGRFLRERMESDRFVSVCYAVVDPQNNQINYASAGHEPPLLRRRDGTVDVLTDGGVFLGTFSKAPYVAHAAQIDPGEILLLYTDGVFDAENRQGESWGRERLLSSLTGATATSAASICDHIRSQMAAHVAGNRPSDDITLAVIRFDGHA